MILCCSQYLYSSDCLLLSLSYLTMTDSMESCVDYHRLLGGVYFSSLTMEILGWGVLPQNLGCVHSEDPLVVVVLVVF